MMTHHTMRTYWVLCATLILLDGLAPHVVAAQSSQTIVLVCNGQRTYMVAAELPPEPLKDVGVIVDLSARTVTVSSYTTPIKDVSTKYIEFVGHHTPVPADQKLKSFTVSGAIDRVTGDTKIHWMYENVGNSSSWQLSCRPSKGALEN